MNILYFLRKLIPSFLINLYHLSLAFIGAVVYGFPSRKIKVIGITGTNGKTTVAEMIFRILEKAGYKTAMTNSIEFRIGNKFEKNLLKMTMPGRFKIQKFLRKAVNSGCRYAVLEVTSEGILQHRHRFIDFEAAIFTNLSPEHIERHGGFDNYRKAKGDLFRKTKNIHIINCQDEEVDYFLQFPAEKKYTYGIEKGDINLSNFEIKLNLPGEFNIYNALAAACFGFSQGIDLETCRKAVEEIKEIPGRMEEVIEKPFRVFVDYAFTPKALEKVYRELRKEINLNRNKMVCLLGACGGGRDKWKRPVLGKIASDFCQEIIITNEDPYDENPLEIISEVESGIVRKNNVYKIIDRRKAIQKALAMADPGDTVIITGKGSEPWMCLGEKEKIPWDDRQIVREEFKYLYQNKD
jgi:UDP-N-acetylmuramoyl-L-alanyl-D-glutamate--2,6-diaminopimelate ligase